MWAGILHIATSQVILIISYHKKDGGHGHDEAKPVMITGFVILMIFALTISLTMFLALYRFYRLVKSLPKSFVLNRGPIFVNALSMFVWVLASLVEEAYLINYYSDWSIYDNVCSVLLVDDICFILDLIMITILAYQLL